MHFIQDLLADSLNGFASEKIPFYIFQLFCAGLLGVVFQLILNKKVGKKHISNGALIAVGVAFMVSVVKYSVPLSIIGAAIILLFLKDAKQSKLSTVSTIILVMIGAGCGYGSVIQTVLGAVVILGIVLFTPLEGNEE